MPKFLVELKHTQRWDVEVEARDPWEAVRLAEEAKTAPERAPEKVEWRGEPLRQLGEPWVWVEMYDVQFTCVVVSFRCSYGNRFSQRDLALIMRRLAEVGMTVEEHWNGGHVDDEGKWHGFDQLSVRCTARGETGFTDEQLAVLEAPR